MILQKAMRSLLCLGPLLFLVIAVSANVEKTIFKAPKPSLLQSHQAMFDDLEIERLSPKTPSTRTYIAASFPSEESPKGFESWFYLDSLEPGQRYEVRICYLATVSHLRYICNIYRYIDKIYRPCSFRSCKPLNHLELMNHQLKLKI